MTPPDTAATAPDGRSGPRMFTALQTTHQHADSKAGVLAAAQAALVGTADAWSRRALWAWDNGGATGALAGALLALFVCGLVGGAVCLAATLRPRVMRPRSANRYSFVHLASGPGLTPGGDPSTDDTADRRELAQTLHFLARVAVRKYRCLTGAVVCTAVMAVSAGLAVALRPLLM
ncbi:Pycsar system effector family protein [Streptomyces sp. NPDC057623]|uniref:Pycsar system effector family protein n=1 Tax=Streptomyces sp. NPDC057623 TaxID=3346187 RepID=UPI00368A5E0C